MSKTEAPVLGKFPLICYSLPSAPISMLMMMLVVYIAPFYAAEIGLELAAVGGIFFAARLWDAIIDPVVGNLSDLTRSKFGRRKPWIFIGTPVLMLAVYWFCQPPEGIGITYLSWMAVLFYIALTVVQIPYLSWGAELSGNYSERTRIVGYRETGTMIGIILATSIPLFFLHGTDPTISDIVRLFTYSILILLPLTIAPTLFFTPKAQPVETKTMHLHKALYALRVNKPFLRLLVAMLLVWVGGSIYNATSFFLVQSALSFTPSDFLWFLFIQYVVGLAAMPFAVKIGNGIGKHRALVFVGMSFFLVLPGFYLVEPGNFTQAACVYALKGMVTAAIWVMPPALIADSIEYGVWKGTGEDTALYMSLYFFIQKAAAAVGVGVAFPLAAWLGFNPQAVDAIGVEGLMLVALVLPGVVAFPAIFLLFNHPITKNRHAAIRRRLQVRGGAST